MVVKDPKFAGVADGLYVWESSYNGTRDPQDNKIKLGVQLTPFKEFYNEYTRNGKLFVRKLYTERVINENDLERIHNVVYGKPNDLVPKDWFQAYKREDNDPQKTTRFWCSALVGYIYTQLGFYPKTTDWSMLRPSDIASWDALTLQNAFLGHIVEL